MKQTQEILRLSNLEYEQRRPEKTVLYKTIQQHYKTVLNIFAQQKTVPYFVEKEFSGFLKCGILSEGFTRAHCPGCDHNKLLPFSCKMRTCPSCGSRRMLNTADHLVKQVLPFVRVRQWVMTFPFQIRYLMAYDAEKLNKILSIVIRAINGFYRRTAKVKGIQDPEFGSIVFIQRFGSMNLNVHFHILFADGAFYKNDKSKIVFEHSKKPTTNEVEEVNRIIKKRVVRYLLKQGILQELEEGNHQFEFLHKDGLDSIYQNSIKRKIGDGKRRGKSVERVGATMVSSWNPKTGERCSYLDGFSLHANVDVSGSSRDKLENLIKYTARPPLANSRISEDFSGHILYELKNKYSDGTTHLRFTPTEFIEKIISIIPPPRKNLIRFFGVFGPHHKNREEITNMIRRRPIHISEIGKMAETNKVISETEKIETIEVIPIKPVYWIPWSDLLKKTFNINALKCEKCGGTMKVANLVTKPNEIKKILLSLDLIDTVNTPILSVDPPLVGHVYIPDYEHRE